MSLVSNQLYDFVRNCDYYSSEIKKDNYFSNANIFLRNNKKCMTLQELNYRLNKNNVNNLSLINTSKNNVYFETFAVGNNILVITCVILIILFVIIIWILKNIKVK